jgi:hypothetical protein
VVARFCPTCGLDGNAPLAVEAPAVPASANSAWPPPAPVQAQPRTPSVIKKRAIVVVIALVVGIVALSNIGGSQPPSGSGTTTASSRCVAAGSPLMATLQDGMLGGATVTNGFYVRSKDFQEVYMVGARLSGPGLDGTDIGIWATGDKDGKAGFVGIDGFAHQFSNWANGSTMKDPISQFADGAQEAEGCADQR